MLYFACVKYFITKLLNSHLKDIWFGMGRHSTVLSLGVQQLSSDGGNDPATYKIILLISFFPSDTHGSIILAM